MHFFDKVHRKDQQEDEFQHVRDLEPQFGCIGFRNEIKKCNRSKMNANDSADIVPLDLFDFFACEQKACKHETEHRSNYCQQYSETVILILKIMLEKNFDDGKVKPKRIDYQNKNKQSGQQ